MIRNLRMADEPLQKSGTALRNGIAIGIAANIGNIMIYVIDVGRNGPKSNESLANERNVNIAKCMSLPFIISSRPLRSQWTSCDGCQRSLHRPPMKLNSSATESRWYRSQLTIFFSFSSTRPPPSTNKQISEQRRWRWGDARRKTLKQTKKNSKKKLANDFQRGKVLAHLKAIARPADRERKPRTSLELFFSFMLWLWWVSVFVFVCVCRLAYLKNTQLNSRMGQFQSPRTHSSRPISR